MAITSVSDIAAAMSAAQRMRFVKNFTAPKGAGYFQSGWLGTGFPGPGAAAVTFGGGGVHQCTSVTAGALGQANGAVKNWLARLQASISQPGVLYVADRLWACSGMLGSTTNTVVTAGNLPARITDNGAGCEAWLEVYAAGTVITGNIDVNYKNVADAAKTSTTNPTTFMSTTPVIGQMYPIPLVSGDTGVRSLVNTVTYAAWGTATFGITILKNLAQIEIPVANTGLTLDWSRVLVEVPADACLFFYFLANGATPLYALGTAWIIDK